MPDQPVSRLVEYFEGIRAIAFAPADAAIVVGEPEGRRRWLDRAAFTAIDRMTEEELLRGLESIAPGDASGAGSRSR